MSQSDHILAWSPLLRLDSQHGLAYVLSWVLRAMAGDPVALSSLRPTYPLALSNLHLDNQREILIFIAPRVPFRDIESATVPKKSERK
jgi:hypothetical protein